MKFAIRHIALLIAAMVLWSSCDDRTASPDIDASGKKEKVCLSFSVAVNEGAEKTGSRGALITEPDGNNYFEQGGDYENIHTLRVIILHEDGSVEKNVKFDFETALSKVTDKEFEVEENEMKTIYLIANESDVMGFGGEDFIEGAFVGSKLTDMTLSVDNNRILIDNRGDTKSYVPMSEFYTMMVPPKRLCKQDVISGNWGVDAGTLFVTRAAVKFTFNVTALFGEGLYLKSLTFNSLADKEYLLPRNTTYYPPKQMPNPFIEITNPGVADQNGIMGHFITDYSIPADASHNPFTFSFTENGGKGVALSKEKVEIAPAMYFCESQLGAPNPTSDGSPYTVSITLKSDADDDEQVFEAVALPNLPILPRNTHVVVNITLAHSDVTAEVQIVPYTGVWLNPTFGIDRDEREEPQTPGPTPDPEESETPEQDLSE